MNAPLAPTGTRQERRKAETRRKIIRAADALFQEKGYAETSIEEIAGAAGVAVRTIYLHFGSKAAIMLSYFDEWLDAFLDAVMERPVDEPVSYSVRAALDALTGAGWGERVEADGRPHPLVEYIGSGPLDIAGHVTHRWMAALSRLTANALQRQESGANPHDAHARAVAIYSLWTAALSASREKERGHPLPSSSGGRPGLTILERLTSGDL